MSTTVPPPGGQYNHQSESTTDAGGVGGMGAQQFSTASSTDALFPSHNGSMAEPSSSLSSASVQQQPQQEFQMSQGENPNQLPEQQQQPARRTGAAGGSKEEIFMLRQFAYRMCIAEGILCLFILLTFWAAFGLPFVVGVVGIITSVIGVSHMASDRDFAHNNCCCGPVDSRKHIVNLHLALVIIDCFGILASIAGTVKAAREEEDERDNLRIVCAVICLLACIALGVCALINFRKCRRLRLKAPTPEFAAIPAHTVMRHTTYIVPVQQPPPTHVLVQGSNGQVYYVPSQQQNTPSQYHAQQQQQQQSSVVVGTIVT